ncbi:ejaculatory bulb-specific protein 3-like precursor [Acyrthosiphon pisum]|uniref:ACYPI009116 protein n=1 Tax=Acyrthosiphon pisum TaxID=7029 RepID=C4WXP3_ACYPI|nr:ejaculatory bulb-specific protein 3-like precursor [Acyrthosiphon pisum]BAH72663.1 ACYPI009116 [Acyrthosiphon pisum]|eukprot:NP_001156287.1 ejaculatory bulb-specific protein 3-like precursor [Acyrthosiphon pisum]
MNKLLLAVAFFIATTMTMVQAAPAKYTTKYDNVNIDDILNNDRLVASYFKCLMETGKCTPEGEEIKRWLPEAVENKCEDCSEKQKIGSEKIIKFLFEKKNDMWKQLEEKYDPKGLYRQRYSEDAKKLNIDV